MDNKAFDIGDEVVFIGANGSFRIPYGEEGVVIGFKPKGEIFPDSSIGVSFPGFSGKFSDLGGLDSSGSALWCSPKNLALSKSAGDISCSIGELEEFLA